MKLETKFLKNNLKFPEILYVYFLFLRYLF